METSYRFINGELHLVTNDRNGITVPISFSAQVVPNLVISPEIISLGQVRPGEHRNKKIILKSAKPFRIVRIESNDQSFKLKADDQPKTLHIVEASFTADQALGRRECVAHIHTDLLTQQKVTVKAVALVDATEDHLTQNK